MEVNTEMLRKVQKFIQKQRTNLAMAFSSGGSSMLPSDTEVYQVLLDYADIGISSMLHMEVNENNTFAGIPVDEAIQIVLEHKNS